MRSRCVQRFIIEIYILVFSSQFPLTPFLDTEPSRPLGGELCHI